MPDREKKDYEEHNRRAAGDVSDRSRRGISGYDRKDERK